MHAENHWQLLSLAHWELDIRGERVELLPLDRLLCLYGEVLSLRFCWRQRFYQDAAARRSTASRLRPRCRAAAIQSRS